MSKTSKKILSLLLSMAILISITACGSSSAPTTSTGDASSTSSSTSPSPSTPAPTVEKVTITFPTEGVGLSMGAKWTTEMTDKFKELYGDTIELKVEEIPNAQSLWDKMQVLMNAKNLPDILMETGRNILPMVIDAGQAVDLTPYIDADPEWKALMDPDAIAQNSRDGKIYAVPSSKMVVGYYYNKELFKKAGIEGPAKTWDEFFADCEKLKAIGVAPMSMDTGDEGWITTLLLGSMIGTDGAEGNKFMNTTYPETYQVPVFINNVKKIQECFQKYTTSDAVGGKYENGASNFFAEKTAMIFNGSWMIGNFTDTRLVSADFNAKVDCAAYPSNGMYNAPRYGYFVGSNTKEKADAAVKYIKLITGAEGMIRGFELFGAMPASNSLVIPEKSAQIQPLGAKLNVFANTATYKYKTYDILWYTPVRTALVTQYPLLAAGDITAEQFAKALDDAAKSAQ